MDDGLQFLDGEATKEFLLAFQQSRREMEQRHNEWLEKRYVSSGGPQRMMDYWRVCEEEAEKYLTELVATARDCLLRIIRERSIHLTETDECGVVAYLEGFRAHSIPDIIARVQGKKGLRGLPASLDDDLKKQLEEVVRREGVETMHLRLMEMRRERKEAAAEADKETGIRDEERRHALKIAIISVVVAWILGFLSALALRACTP